MRPFGLRNWSHCLNNALPAAVKIREHLAALELPAPVFILKDDTFSKVRDLFGALGLEYLCTDRVVNAPLIRIEIAHGPILNQNAREFTAPIADQIDTLVASVPEMSGTKVFLNRKAPQRSLTNADEITALLTERGYQEYFLEDHSAAEQIAIILRASEIVAIHGAALAPVVFRRPEHGPFQFVEIYSPGHVVPLFRDMTEDLPCTYRMVRGVPNPDMASEAYSEVDSPSMNFTNKHSLKPFRLDPVSLQIALDSTESDDFPLGLINQPK